MIYGASAPTINIIRRDPREREDPLSYRKEKKYVRTVD